VSVHYGETVSNPVTVTPSPPTMTMTAIPQDVTGLTNNQTDISAGLDSMSMSPLSTQVGANVIIRPNSPTMTMSGETPSIVFTPVQGNIDVDASTGLMTMTPINANVVAPIAAILDLMSLGGVSSLPSAPGNTSDILYNPNNDLYYTVINGTNGNQDVYSVSGETWTHEADVSRNLSHSDTEGVCWLQQGGNRFMMCEESSDSTVYVLDYTGGGAQQEHHLPARGVSNKGLEGVSWASEAQLAQGAQPAGAHGNGAFYVVQEDQPQRAYRCEMPPYDGLDYSWDYPADDGQALLQITEFTAPDGSNLEDYLESVGCSDMAAVLYDPRNGDGRLIVVAEQARQLFEFQINADKLTYVADIAIDSEFQWEGICQNPDGDYVIVSEGNSGAPRIQILTYTGDVIESAPSIAVMQHVTMDSTDTLSVTAILDSGGAASWYLKKAPPSATINVSTGDISWNPDDDLPRGQAVSFRIGCCNSFGHATPVSLIVHVNFPGQTGQIHVTGEGVININIGPAAEQILGNDTLIVTGTNRNIASTNDGAADDPDYINTFVRANTGGGQFIAPGGTNAQLTTICAQDPFLVVSGAPHAGFPHWTNFGLDMSGGQNGYVKFMDYTIREVGRKVADIATDNTFFDGMGFYDAANEFEEINGRKPATNLDADAGLTSRAVVAFSGASECLTELCHVGGNGRYMFQDGSGAGDNNIRRWCVARPDEHHGDQPRGGFLMYSVKGGRDYNNTLIDGDQEDFTPFFKSVAGAYALPATGNESRPEDQERHRCGTLNTHMCVFGLLDGSGGELQRASWDDHWAFDVESQSAPQSGNNCDAIVQSSSQYCNINRASIGRVWNHNLATRVFMRGSNNNMTNSILSEIGWNGSVTVNMGNMFSSINSFTGTIYAFAGTIGAGVTPTRTTNPHDNGWEYLPRIEAGSTLDVAGEGAQAAFLKGKPFHRKGDPDEAMNTNIPAWPHPMEDVFRQHNRNYFKTGLVKRLDEFNETGTLDGKRGFCVDNETYSEYIWGYLGFMLPPMRIAYAESGGVVTFVNFPLESFREANRTGWRIYKSTDLENPVASVASRTRSVDVSGLTSGSYIITNTFNAYLPSNWMNGDESGPSIQTLSVTI